MIIFRDVLVIITPCRRNDNLSRCTTVVVLVKLMFLHIIQRPHPTPILQGESCANLVVPKTIGKTKKTKQPKRSRQKPSKTIGKTQKTTTKKQTFEPMTLFDDIGSKVLLFLCFSLNSQWFLMVLALTSVVVLFFLVFPMVFDILNRVHGQTR